MVGSSRVGLIFLSSWPLVTLIVLPFQIGTGVLEAMNTRKVIAPETL